MPLPLYDIPVVAAGVALHECLRPDHAHLGIEPFGRRVIPVTGEDVAEVAGVGLAVRFRPEAFRDLDFERLRRVLDDLERQHVLPETAGLAEVLGICRQVVLARLLDEFRHLLSRGQVNDAQHHLVQFLVADLLLETSPDRNGGGIGRLESLCEAQSRVREEFVLLVGGFGLFLGLERVQQARPPEAQQRAPWQDGLEKGPPARK